MLTIRLTRKGKKNQPFFRVVVIDKRRSAKGGRAAEILGFIDPLTKKKSLKKERILHWIKNGAQPSATMHNLLVKEKIISGKKINVSKKSKKPVEVAISTPTLTPTLVQTVPTSTPDIAMEIPTTTPVVELEKIKEVEKPAEQIQNPTQS